MALSSLCRSRLQLPDSSLLCANIHCISLLQHFEGCVRHHGLALVASKALFFGRLPQVRALKKALLLLGAMMTLLQETLLKLLELLLLWLLQVDVGAARTHQTGGLFLIVSLRLDDLRVLVRARLSMPVVLGRRQRAHLGMGVRQVVILRQTRHLGVGPLAHISAVLSAILVGLFEVRLGVQVLLVLHIRLARRRLGRLHVRIARVNINLRLLE